MKCLLLIALVAVAYCEVKEDENVLVVTTDNWDEAVPNDANVLVEFCKVLLFIYSIDDCGFYRFS